MEKSKKLRKDRKNPLSADSNRLELEKSLADDSFIVGELVTKQASAKDTMPKLNYVDRMKMLKDMRKPSCVDRFGQMKYLMQERQYTDSLVHINPLKHSNLKSNTDLDLKLREKSLKKYF